MADVIRCVSPVDGRVYAERPVASQGEIDAALENARHAQVAWAQTPLSERARRCNAMVDAMVAMRDEIAPELSWQMGRPVRFAGGELNGFEERARYMIAIADEALAPVTPKPKDGYLRYIQREPLGVVFIIAPWNYPYLTAVNSVVPALMAGNTVILKHASQTLLVGDRFQAACDNAGLPEHVFRNLNLTHEQAARVIASRRIDRVNFTGSVGGGRAMERASAGAFIGVGLELGGKDPAYVRSDADLPFATENVADGAFFNSGQSCCGVERIYVHADVFDQFVERFADAAREYKLDDPLDPDTTMGPMVRPEAAEFVRGQIRDAERSGAHSLVDTKLFERDTPGSAYMAPQVLVDVTHEMSVMTEESFGPVVGIMKVSGDEEAVARMNDSRFGLTASIWTSDVEAAASIGSRIDTGTVYMNRCDYLDPALSWTGVKDTGRGTTLSRIGYESLTRPKSFNLRTKI